MTASEKEVDAVVHSGDDEAFKAEHTEQTVPMPSSIASMSAEEIRIMETKMVRKMDIVIM